MRTDGKICKRVSKGKLKELESINGLRRRCKLPELKIENKQKRSCLMCNQAFFSEGNWNRICGKHVKNGKNECD
mgnify:CR=1 FL=1